MYFMASRKKVNLEPEPARHVMSAESARKPGILQGLL